jgi:hypothetical protein
MRWAFALGLVLALSATLAFADSTADLAASDAAQSLQLLQLPDGATRVTDNPAAEPALLDAPGVGAPATPNLVDQHEFWRVPGAPQDVIAWLKAHRPVGSRIFAEGSGGKNGTPAVWSVEFDRKPAAGLLSQRGLSVTAARAGDGATALRVDALVVWVTQRPATERVPAGARSIDVLVTGPNHEHLSNFSVGTRASVAAVARLLNRLPVIQPGVFLCPLDRGLHVHLTFRGTGGRAALASALATIGGCASVDLSIGGVRQTPLAGYGFFDELQSIVGVIDLSQVTGPIQPQPVVPVGGGKLPGGGRFAAAAYVLDRVGVCVDVYMAFIKRGSACAAHPRGKRSSAVPLIACFPRAVTGFIALGGAGVGAATVVFDDGVRMRGRVFRLKSGTVSTRYGTTGSRLVYLKKPTRVHLGYTGPVLLGFRRGTHDPTAVETFDASGTTRERLDSTHWPFAVCGP